MNPHIANSRIAVKAKVFPYDYWHDRYQEYYQAGLALYLSSIGLKLKRTPPADFSTLFKLLRRVLMPAHSIICLETTLKS